MKLDEEIELEGVLLVVVNVERVLLDEVDETEATVSTLDVWVDNDDVVERVEL